VGRNPTGGSTGRPGPPTRSASTGASPASRRRCARTSWPGAAALSGALSAGIYGISGTPALALGSFAAGFLIDLDHLVDYWREYPFRFDVRHFFSTCNEYRLNKTYLWLHSLELLALLAPLAFLLRSALLAGIALGAAQHLLFDHLFNRSYPQTYFFFFRMRQGFENRKVFRIPARPVDTQG
jgi:hypothetical protein